MITTIIGFLCKRVMSEEFYINFISSVFIIILKDPG